MGALAGAVGFGATVFGMDAVSAAKSQVNLAQVREDIADIINDLDVVNPSVDDGAQGGGGGVGPMFLRLARHSSGTWDAKAKNGGSEGGTMRFSEGNHGGNAGLHHARNMLESVKAKHPGITYADLYILAGVVAIDEMGGPKVSFRSGRSDASAEVSPAQDSRFSPDGRLPDGHKDTRELTIQHLRDIFCRMGFDDQAIVCLSGAHAVGRCHTDRSGYWGPWTYGETTFSNDYYQKLLDKSQGWRLVESSHGSKGGPQFVNSKDDLMMLQTDMALTWDPSFRKWVEIYANDEERFFADFAKYYQQLNELGCPNLSGGNRKYLFFGPRD